MKKHLSVFAYGPVYIISISALTCLGFVMTHFNFIPDIRLSFWNIFGKILAVMFILIGGLLWFNAVIIVKLEKNIKENKLVTDGAYAWVRNPIYTAGMFIMWGLIFWNGNLCLLPMCLVYYVMMVLLVKLTEEKWLTELYGKTYIDYCKNVNRCIPWFPKKT